MILFTNRRAIYWAVILISTLTQCKESAVNKINEEKLVSVITDLHILGISFREIDSIPQEGDKYWDMIERKHGVTRPQIEEVYQELFLDSEKMSALYRKVEDRLNEMEKETYELKYQTKSVKKDEKP